MIKMPPAPEAHPLSRILQEPPALAEQYLQFYVAVDDKGRYQPYDELRFRVPTALDPGLAWSLVKAARQLQQAKVIELGTCSHPCTLVMTPAIHKAISQSDRHTTAGALEWMSSSIGEQRHVAYLLKDLIEDEAISSSQLEGAATTTKVAKDLLKRQRGPRTLDEKMIVGNFRMMQWAWTYRKKPLTVDVITELHQIGVEGIDDNHYRPGNLRTTDDQIVVVDGDGNVVHTPPPALGLKSRLQRLVDWINSDDMDLQDSTYLHPLVKAIVLHFAIGYEHPFHDGNGRVARSLFYWYLFKTDFAAFRYIAISTLLKTAATQYGKSYLHTENDQMDLTYFVDYQCRIISRAIASFQDTYEKNLRDMTAFDGFLYESGLYRQLNDKQKTVLQVAKSGRVIEFTASNVKDNLGCSYNTAAAVLNGLVEHQVFERRKEGREWVYFMVEKSRIIKDWIG
jgi:Fic family protein